VTAGRKRVAILGGGMAGLAAAWRLSEPGWRNRLESITVYQRGWRLGGKGASSRGEHGRIEEHGLHIWLGSYENAFALLRQCYSELDRENTDPAAPIRHWFDAMIPADDLGLADRANDAWLTWLGTFARNDLLPGDPDGDGREMTVVGFLRRALQLIFDFADSVRDDEPGLTLSPSPDPTAMTPRIGPADALRRAAVAAVLATAEPGSPRGATIELVDRALDAVRAELDDRHRPADSRTWLLISMVTAVVRGILADNLVTDPRGFRAINDQDFAQWILANGGHPDVVDFPLIRGVYDLVFGYVDADPERPSFAAGLMLFLIGMVLFEYKGAIFWKMTAGMGDVIIAPIYQALRRRGVEFEFFSRVDSLHLDDRRQAVDAITLGVQAELVDGVGHYEPLVRSKGLPVFPAAPVPGQLAGEHPEQDWHHLETHFGARREVGSRVLRRGTDFDDVILAVSLGMIPVVAAELMADRREWQEMTTHVRTVATQAVQLWFRPDEPALGWDRPGVTVSAYLRPFETWASMPQTLWAEEWPDDDRPGTVAYFCGSLDAPWPTSEPAEGYTRRLDEQVHAEAAAYFERNLGLYFPNAFGEQGFDWSLLHGVTEQRGAAALRTQHVSVNIDPSDRYVQSVPGSDRYRLRPDESGYDNLFLAGDWTDCGMNAGCIEAATMSGLQAANCVLGHGRFYRVRGYWLP